MEELEQKMKEVLATTFTMYLKAHQFHWNVVGPNFAEYHSYLGDLYTEIHASIDTTAEEIRQLNAFAPAGYRRYMTLSRIPDTDGIPENSRQMIWNMWQSNEIVIKLLLETRAVAEAVNAYSTVNYLDDRLSAHRKHAWMLNSFLKE